MFPNLAHFPVSPYLPLICIVSSPKAKFKESVNSKQTKKPTSILHFSRHSNTPAFVLVAMGTAVYHTNVHCNELLVQDLASGTSLTLNPY